MVENPKNGKRVWYITYYPIEHDCPLCGESHKCGFRWKVNCIDGELIDEVFLNSRTVRLCGWARVCRVEDLFLTIKEAQAECDKRNKKGAKNDVDGRDA